MKTRTYLAIGLALGVIGLGLVWYATSWVAALGLFLVVWSNNFREIRAR